MRKKYKLWLSLALLLAGGMVYVLFRPRTLVLFVLADMLGVGGCVDALRAMASAWHPSEFVVYCVPNGLWALAYVLVVDWVMQAYGCGTRLLCTSFMPLLGAASELMQLAGWLRGTFDVGDLVCYLLPYIIYVGICLLRKRRPKP